MTKASWLLVFGAYLAGCASHEGGLSSAPVTPPATKPADAAPPKPVTFHYAPDKPEYRYVVLTNETATGGTPRNAELDFTVKVGRKGKQFTNDSTVQAVLDGGVQIASLADKMKVFHVVTTLDGAGKILTSRATAAEGLLPEGSADLGASITLPTKPMLPGEKWVEKIHTGDEDYEATYTFTGIETEGAQRIATFEKLASDVHGAKSLRPTIIKIDADTGVLIDKVADIVFKDPTNPGIDVTAHFETKLK
jgi:hypothetical protein